MRSKEIKQCLNLCLNDFQKNFTMAKYSESKDASETILNLTRALSYQLQIEEKYKDESEDKLNGEN